MTRRGIASEACKVMRCVYYIAALGLLSSCLPQVCAAQDPRHKRSDKPVELNSATVEQLQDLPGIGPEIAKKIIEMREKSGPFRRVEDLLAIRGISKKRLEALRSYLTVAPPAAPPKK